MELTFDQLPHAVGLLVSRLERIEQLLQKQALPVTENKEEIIALDEACKLLNLAKATVYGLVSQRKLPHMKQGKKLYFSKQELTEWLKQGHKAVKEDLAVVVDSALTTSRRKKR